MTRPALLIAILALVWALPAAAQDRNSWTTLERGLYLVRAGDCAACHTTQEDKPFAGNKALPTPFGTIYSSNLTPDRQTGIGDWTSDEFYRAMTKGIAADGERLYPAFPYTHFTKITREDSNDIFAYLQTLDPVEQTVQEPDLVWPLSVRELMASWNLINFDEGPFVPDPERSETWNRGAYLVEGLGHCSLCHSPKNVMGAEKGGDELYTGGEAEGWWAPALTGDRRDGLGDWSREEIAEYLKHGRNARTAALGPMAEVVERSTSHLTDADATAIATYLKTLPPRGNDEDRDGIRVADDVRSLGENIYDAQCSACHAPNGAGVPRMFAPLAGSSFTQAENPRSLIRLILEGGRAAATDKFPTPHAMPAFDWKLTDADVAAVASYVRNAFGNAAPVVSADDVAGIREEISARPGTR